MPENILNQLYGLATRIDLRKVQKAKYFIGLGLLSLVAMYLRAKKNSEALHQQQISNCLKKRNAVQQNMAIFMEQVRAEIDNISPQLKSEIIMSNIKGIHQLYQSRKATVKQVLLTFIEQTFIEGKKFNLIMTPLFEQAYEEAQELDKLLQININVVHQYPLFGIPVSMKDFLSVKGADTTFAIGSRCFNPCPYDGHEAALVRQAKGLIFMKGNVPQLGMSMETHNNIFGRALNPQDPSRTTGGSSGGEAGLIKSRCAVISVGTDTAGSLRTPAAFCGVWSYKASSARFPYPKRFGATPDIMLGMNQIQSIPGPIANSLEDLEIMLKVLFGSIQVAPMATDPYHNNKNNTPEQYRVHSSISQNGSTSQTSKQLRIALLPSIDLVPAFSMNQHIVHVASQHLQNKGCVIVPAQISQEKLKSMVELCFKLLLIDSELNGYKELLKGENFIDDYKGFVTLSRVPKSIIRILTYLARKFGYERDHFLLHIFSKQSNAVDLLKLIGQQQRLKSEIYQWWVDNDIDALITPVTAAVAFKHGQSRNASMSAAYTMIWNLVDYNGAVVPLNCHYKNQSNYVSQCQSDKFHKTIQDSIQGIENLQQSVQVITKPFDDHISLEVMRLLADL